MFKDKLTSKQKITALSLWLGWLIPLFAIWLVYPPLFRYLIIHPWYVLTIIGLCLIIASQLEKPGPLWRSILLSWCGLMIGLIILKVLNVFLKI